ncbi:MAG TPA: MmcQ/YjbR family DNA-binding protein [Tepidiformaceae bacterium]|nr:MmcQ/YjbR family DNA-binding protein [Tepidiformaceae bacterium]
MTLDEAESALRDFALSYPEAWEDFPWEERVIKVRKKIFVFLGVVEAELRIGVKLPESAPAALTIPGVVPAGYGLGKSGWVDVRYSAADSVPLDLLREWIDESYRAIAPKTLVAKLPPPGSLVTR